MALFATAPTAPIASTEQDVIRSSKWTVDSGVYPAVIKMAYKDKSKSSAAECIAFEFALMMPNGKPRSFRETIWITNREGQVMTEKDGQMVPSIGYQTLNTITQLALGHGAEQLSAEPAMLEIKKGQALEQRDVIKQLIGGKVNLGIIERRVNKQVNNGTAWVDSPETREVNIMDKVFDFDTTCTVAEKAAGGSPIFVETWKAEFEGKLQDRSKKIDGPVAAGGVAGGSAVQTGSLI